MRMHVLRIPVRLQHEKQLPDDSKFTDSLFRVECFVSALLQEDREVRQMDGLNVGPAICPDLEVKCDRTVCQRVRDGGVTAPN